jgi:3-keto-L-gulonate-6-phosphate decarboxylase
MIDMMGIEYPLEKLKRLKKLPKVVILHRGVDESNISKFKLLPYYQIKQIKGAYNHVLIAVAGGDTLKEMERSIFNGADIITVWKDFYSFKKDENNIVDQFLKQIK